MKHLTDVEMDLPGYNYTSKIVKSIGALKGSKKPLILCGHGVVISKATNVKKLAETLGASVVSTVLVWVVQKLMNFL